jgi:hypothetical protein
MVVRDSEAQSTEFNSRRTFVRLRDRLEDTNASLYRTIILSCNVSEFRHSEQGLLIVIVVVITIILVCNKAHSQLSPCKTWLSVTVL